MAIRAVVVGIASALGACSPYGGGAFVCQSNAQCGAGGTCEPDGHCAFPDATCASGLKYGEAAGSESNQCVGATGGSDDGGIVYMDARPDTPPDQFCYGTGLVTTCFSTAPTGAVTLSQPIDTSTYACATVLGTDPGCVIAADTITVSGTVTVTGPKPLVLVAVHTITVSGTLDASSRRGGQTGAGADATACSAGTAPSGGHDGGGGGSFGDKGGDGAGGAGKGLAGAAIAATSFHGGCPGQKGGGGGSGGDLGHGGGAIYLIADATISIQGTLDASGAGAGGSKANAAGGGGAGSGGMIVLDSPAVSGGTIFANGGGGGEGGSSLTGTGGDGEDPTSPDTAANGGSGSQTGGNGGRGAAGTTLTGSAGQPGNNGGGNGGGGGGAGIVKLYRATAITGGSVSPPPS